MRTFLFTLALVAAPLAARAGDNTQTLVDNGKKTSYACKAGDTIEIAGNQNTVTTTGDCAAVRVTGNQNTVTVESAGAVDVPGNNNKVSWKHGLAGKDASVSNLGKNNTVTHAK